ncbi:MAG: SPOR domain-containing protein [Spirochaetota bacterium]
MKERTFYTFNLDIKRILLLLVLLIAVLVYVFLFGRKLGQRQVSQTKENEVSQEQKETDVSNKAEIKKSHGDVNPDTIKQPQTKSDVVDLNKLNSEDEIESETEAPLEEKKEIQESTIITSDNLSKTAATTKPVIRKKKRKPRRVAKKSGPRYTIQLGAFSTIERATEFKSSIASNNSLKTFPYIQPRGELFLVRLGKESNREKLQQLIDELGSEYAKSARIVKYSR